MSPSPESPIAGVRRSRHGPLVLAAVEAARSPGVGELVLLDQGGVTGIALVVVSPDQLLAPPSETPVARIVAVGAGDPLVAQALAARDRAALAEARAVVAGALDVGSARWSADLGRLTLVIERPKTVADEIRLMLGRHFRAQVHLVVEGEPLPSPGGEAPGGVRIVPKEMPR